MGEKLKNGFYEFIGGIIAIYIIVASIMSVLYMIYYIKVDESLFDILIIDPLIAGVKGILWIFFIWGDFQSLILTI